MKKLLALIVAMAMILSLATTAFAADGDEPETPATPATYSITINNSATGHTYEAYQIFVGKLSEEAENDNNGDNTTTNNTTAVLSNVQWGASVTNQSGSAASVAERLANNYEGEDKLTVDGLLAMITLKDNAYASTNTQTDNKYVISGLEPGYYLIKDQDGSLQGEHDSYTKFILEVLENSTVSPKFSKPSVQKKVDDINDSNNTENAEDWQDSADYDIHDSVPFQLKATLASNVEDYKSYKIVFHDTMSKGLTFQRITKVTIDGKEVDSGYIVKTEQNEDGTTSLSIVFGNIKYQGGTNNSEVIVEYVAELNEHAELGNTGNPNYVYLEYSNNPNWEGDGDLDDDGIPNDEDEDDDNDGKPDNEDDDDDNDGKKDDEDDDDDNDGTKDEDEDDDDDEGDEPTGKTPEDKVIVFTYKVVVDKVHQTGTETDENGETKPVYSALPGAGFTLFKWKVVTPATETTAAVYDWVAIGETLTGVTTFEWKGLDDGKYKLEETITPPGYNTIPSIEFEITAEHDLTWESEAQTAILTKLEGGNLATGDVSTGAIEADVINNAGATLPETGGIGTTIFYAAGAMLVLCAVILLITKKRMGAAE